MGNNPFHTEAGYQQTDQQSMNTLVYHIASGQAFFTGVALVIVAALVSMRSSPLSKRISGWAFLIGATAIALSSTPIPYWFYAVALTITALWILSRYVKALQKWSPAAVVLVWAGAAAMEIPYHITPQLNPSSTRSLTVIGDSVTAGMGSDDAAERWPIILARENNIVVQDISHMGETASSALKRAKKNPIASQIVLLEIGGNDLLGSTTATQFEEDLESLLQYVIAPDRQIVMFELPLPPFYHEYGRIQRTLAKKYNVYLIPKRIFLSILAGNEATLDSIHLSQAGHKKMKACVWDIIKPAMPVIQD